MYEFIYSPIYTMQYLNVEWQNVVFRGDIISTRICCTRGIKVEAVNVSTKTCELFHVFQDGS